MKKVLLLVGTFLLLVPLATAAPLCTTGLNVEVLGTCDFGGLTFSNWSVTPVGGVSDANIFLSPLSNTTGGVVNMVFQMTTTPSPVTSAGDVLFSYMVSGMTLGADLILGTSTAPVTIIENVCADDPSDGCTTELASFTVTKGVNNTAVEMYAPTSQVWISKDIQFSGAGGSLSDFTNSHHVPEPVTYMLMGSGLLALGLLRRRVRK